MKTTPIIIEMYKEIYNNYIKKENEIKERYKQMYEADIAIHTMENTKKENKLTKEQKEKAKKLWKYQKNKIYYRK